MLGYQQAPCVENEHTQVGVSVDLLGAICSEHPGPDDNGIECHAAVLRGFVPGVADAAPKDVDGKTSFLDLARSAWLLDEPTVPRGSREWIRAQRICKFARHTPDFCCGQTGVHANAGDVQR